MAVTPEQIARINELAHKKKAGLELTADELAEQQNLRQLYLDSVKANLRAQLEGIKPIKEAEEVDNESQADSQ